MNNLIMTFLPGYGKLSFLNLKSTVSCFCTKLTLISEKNLQTFKNNLPKIKVIQLGKNHSDLSSNCCCIRRLTEGF